MVWRKPANGFAQESLRSVRDTGEGVGPRLDIRPQFEAGAGPHGHCDFALLHHRELRHRLRISAGMEGPHGALDQCVVGVMGDAAEGILVPKGVEFGKLSSDLPGHRQFCEVQEYPSVTRHAHVPFLVLSS
ncbi:hypothetical protein [Microvirga sp. TS319]|uniref:hypothetical protein n=1 Tax=Microvirga sp. TS319 TaxID=3241165 RepID=UPI00351A2B0A